MPEVLSYAGTYLDFYSGAYYTPVISPIPIRPNKAGVPLPKQKGHASEQSAQQVEQWKGIRQEQTKSLR